MKQIFTFISLFIIFEFLTAVQIDELKKRAPEKGINPLLLKLVSTNHSDQGINEFTWSVNSILLQEDLTQRYLWADIAAGKTEYPFFTQKIGNTAEETRELTIRRVDDYFRQLTNNFGNELQCKSHTNEDLAKIDSSLDLKITELYNKFFEIRLKGLLYQMLPGGKLQETQPTIVFTSDWPLIKEEILRNLKGFFDCVDSRREGNTLKSNVQPSLWSRFWNWLKSLFGGSKQSGIQVTPREVFTQKLEAKFADAEELLRNDAFDLSKLSDLIYHPAREIFNLLRFEIFENVSRVNASNIASLSSFESPLFEYILYFNLLLESIDKDETPPQSLLLFSQEMLAFHKELGKSYTELSPRSKEASKALIIVEQSLLKLSLKMNPSFAFSCAREFLSAFKMDIQTHLSDKASLKNPFQEIIKTKDFAHPIINNFALVIEAINQAPSDDSLKNQNQLVSRIIDLIGKTDLLQDNLIRLMSVSQILTGFPFGLAKKALDFYPLISKEITDFLASKEIQGEGIEKFAKLFDSKLDQNNLDSNNSFAHQHYPLLKILNLWASKGALTTIKLGQISPKFNNELNQIVADNKQFYQQLLELPQLKSDDLIDFQNFSGRELRYQQVADFYKKNQEKANPEITRI